MIALRARDAILARNRTLVSRNLGLLEAFMAGFPGFFEWYRPDGGCICYPRYRGDDGVEEFTRRLVDQVGVLLLPASVYRSDLGETPSDRFRIGFGRNDMPEALAVLRDFLEDR